MQFYQKEEKYLVDERNRKEREVGITLIALVITIIILLILAGISIASLSDNGLFGKAKQAKENSEIATQKEDETLGQYGTAIEEYLEDDDGIDPAEEYGYASNSGVVEASTLKEGDHIWYYYKDSEGEIQKVECIVLYGPNSRYGLQVISAESLGSVILGYNDSTLPSTADGYDFSGENYESLLANVKSNANEDEYKNFEKARWSYNNAIKTLNNYAENYNGYMARGIRSVGSNPSNKNSEGAIMTKDNCSYYNDEGELVAGEVSWMTTGGWYNKFKLGDTNILSSSIYTGSTRNTDESVFTNDAAQMNKLEILKASNEERYWCASRYLKDNSHDDENGEYYYYYFGVNRVNKDGAVKGANILSLFDNAIIGHGDNNLYQRNYGLRFVATLKSNIKVEKK